MTTMTTMTTPITKGWRSDDSIILPGWSVTPVGLGQYPRCTSAIKDGRSSAVQATDKDAKHHRSTTGTRSTQKLSHHGKGSTVECDSAMCFQVVQVWLLSSQCGCVKHGGDCSEGRTNRSRARDIDVPVLRSTNRLLKSSRRSRRRSTLRSSWMRTSMR